MDRQRLNSATRNDVQSPIAAGTHARTAVPPCHLWILLLLDLPHTLPHLRRVGLRSGQHFSECFPPQLSSGQIFRPIHPDPHIERHGAVCLPHLSHDQYEPDAEPGQRLHALG